MIVCRAVALVFAALTLATGCVSSTVTREPPPWPVLDTSIEPDKDVRPPAWYQPREEHNAWPLGEEPGFATEAWRQWCALRYNSRGIIRWVETPPDIDGKLNDAVWKDTALAGQFVNTEMRRASPSTTVFLAYDKDMLYVAARAIEPNSDDICCTPSQRDAIARSDDLFEVNLAPRWKDKTFRVFWFLVNPAGSVSDGIDAESNWNANLKAAAIVSEGSWTLELAIPFQELGVSVDDLCGEVWACQFVRHRRAGGVYEVSSWTRILNATTGTSHWGYVIFKGPKPGEPGPDKPSTEREVEKGNGR